MTEDPATVPPTTPTVIPPITATDRKPASFRLTPHTLRLIALAVNDARARGRLATKGEVIEQAVRATYGHLDTP
jgi:hypothetical protein